MRIYTSFPEALNEIKRDLKEMGISVHTKSVQNIHTAEDVRYNSLEIQNYIYTVTMPDFNDIPIRDHLWAEQEFTERTSGLHLNPGTAWLHRRGYWEQFLDRDGKFDYSYPERLACPLQEVINLIKTDNSTRRAFVAVFDRSLDVPNDLSKRIPCSLGYWFNWRQRQLNMTYLQRSADFSEHFNYDVYLAERLHCHVAQQTKLLPGSYTHWLGSLHVFAKDVSGVF